MINYYETELQPGEKYLWNMSRSHFPGPFGNLNTFRIGIQAYDIYGEKLPISEFGPCFINKSEVPELNLAIHKKYGSR